MSDSSTMQAMRHWTVGLPRSCPVAPPLPTKLMACKFASHSSEQSDSDLSTEMPDMSHDTSSNDEGSSSKFDDIISGGVTTLVIHNVPNRYSQEALVQDFKGFSFDFLFLPFRVKQRRSSKYAFVNFSSPTEAAIFRARFDGTCLGTSKIPVTVGNAKTQGFASNVLLHAFNEDALEKHRPFVYIMGRRVGFQELAQMMAGHGLGHQGLVPIQRFQL
eukprot:CAMPEP_0115102728 /NCGR_PEP_ID=MMETSP0227-20121206/34094_1 /TAXON_ID=89957 /ORGANISM="Polarella glacialis, Strain CCMP 1383" /LENGTH=216 /DNA_ID=CAMNT_0002498913 /DNA_START=37 /DNA_END=687 /DNA_ORIENTATION=+